MAKTVRREIKEWLLDKLRTDKTVIIIGEDVCDPYGGVSKVTRGLSKLYPDRVINTPIAEATLMGLGAGLNHLGYSPIVEVMFSDFLLLGIDQLVNQMTLNYKVWGVPPPQVFIRAMVGKPEYGPTHSRSHQLILSHLGLPVFWLRPDRVKEQLDSCYYSMGVKILLEKREDYDLEVK